MDADTDVGAQASIGDWFARSEIEEVFARDIHVIAFAVDLICLRHDGVEGVERELHHAGMRHPRAVVAVVCFSLLIGAHFGKSFFVRLWVVFDRNLRGHSAHRESGSPMARLNAEQGVRMHEMRGHGDQGAVGQQKIALVPEPFNTREDVVPAATVEPGRMIA